MRMLIAQLTRESRRTLEPLPLEVQSPQPMSDAEAQLLVMAAAARAASTDADATAGPIEEPSEDLASEKPVPTVSTSTKGYAEKSIDSSLLRLLRALMVRFTMNDPAVWDVHQCLSPPVTAFAYKQTGMQRMPTIDEDWVCPFPLQELADVAVPWQPQLLAHLSMYLSGYREQPLHIVKAVHGMSHPFVIMSTVRLTVKWAADMSMVALGHECKHGVGVPYNLMTVMVTDENGNPKKLSFSTVMHRLYDKMMYEVLFQFFGQT
jgi:hypothetical protein